MRFQFATSRWAPEVNIVKRYSIAFFIALAVLGITARAYCYNAKIVKKAFDLIGQKNPDNPKRIYSYVVGIIENLDSLSQ